MWRINVQTSRPVGDSSRVTPWTEFFLRVRQNNWTDILVTRAFCSIGAARPLMLCRFGAWGSDENCWGLSHLHAWALLLTFSIFSLKRMPNFPCFHSFRQRYCFPFLRTMNFMSSSGSLHFVKLTCMCVKLIACRRWTCLKYSLFGTPCLPSNCAFSANLHGE